MFLKEVSAVALITVLAMSIADANQEIFYSMYEEKAPTEVTVKEISSYQTLYTCDWSFDSLSIVEKDYRRVSESDDKLLDREQACVLIRRIIRNTEWVN
jgi:hypothetical protein